MRRLLAVLPILGLFLTGCGKEMEKVKAPRPIVTENADVLAGFEPEPDYEKTSQASGELEEPEEKPALVFQVEELPAQIQEIMMGEGGSHGDISPVELAELCYVTASYLDFEGATRQGSLVIHRELAQEVAEIFEELYWGGFPIAGIALVEAYGADDSLSMAANNTYSYCSRYIAGTQTPSLHSYGVAIDINPVQNPYLAGGAVYPIQGKKYLDRDNFRQGMIMPGGVCYEAFVSRGWSWGGHWAAPDYQHFEKWVG